MEKLQFKQIGIEDTQNCPFCDMPQEGFVKGTIIKDGILEIHDKWYSFCNCRNIFFTDWSNMEQEVYDETYQDKYDNPEAKGLVLSLAQESFNLLPKKDGLFVEIGVVTDTILDEADKRGYNTLAVDINDATTTKHDFLCANPDNDDMPKDISVIWASHVFEHFEDPINVAKKMYRALSDDGCLYVAMPDPWFIPWANPHLWAHWHCKEHHIMWDMDSFIDMCEEIGFELVTAKRKTFGAEYRIILKKVVK